ncbi:TatD family hydrolase [Spiroplasma culicicola]|uniref:Mg-dependent DNase n=1 Tax=Spiroplasma culicicola AES-1 TaxID=1276246 RepID=W6A8R3_9MOLU|nr:TatD family hydrolase [Spiroplasma culicicola]AHI53407.1 Mg-dependent DNase [Spiroplasma culicicola AES-1]
MAGIFDTHTHFNDKRYKELGIETDEMIKEANMHGVTHFCCVGFDVHSSKQATKYAIKYENVYAAVGIHPTEADKTTEDELNEIEIAAHAENVVAIGEIGLDYYYTDEFKEKQKEIFKRQIQIALDNDLLVMMHLRDVDGSDQAYYDALEILDELEVKRAVVHCYTKGYELAKKFTDKGYYISIPGVVTFNNAIDLQEAVQKLSINHLVVETDAPYLAPVPNRGKLNTSKEIVHTIDKIAKLKNLNKDDVIDSTTRNAQIMFGILNK